MFICFADEAGKPEPTHHVFVMAGVIINASRWAEFEAEFEILKEKYELARDDEIHAAWLDSDDLTKQQEQIPEFVSMSTPVCLCGPYLKQLGLRLSALRSLYLTARLRVI